MIEDQDVLVWKGRPHDQFYIIRNVDIHAGFSALLLYTLNGIRKAQELNAIPVINFNKENTPDFYDSEYGVLIWNYYFDPISPFSYQQVMDFVSTGQIGPDQVYVPTSEEVMDAHHTEENRLATFWASETPENKMQWMTEKRALGREYVSQYLSPKSHIAKKVSEFVATHFEQRYVFGVHIRGTDFNYAQATPTETYFREIDQLIVNKGITHYKVFLATDQTQFLDAFKNKYGTNLICYDALRSADHVAPFRKKTSNPYKKGEDVLIDILLLSKCDFLLKGPAAVGEVALWFNQRLECNDFALQNDFLRTSYDKAPTVFASLNIGKKNALGLKLHRAKQRTIKFLQGTRLIAPFYRRFHIVRKILKH